MAVAICVSGQARAGAWVAPHLLEWASGFGDEVDWFVHLWDWSQQKRTFNGVEFPRRMITHADVSAIRDVLRPREMVVECHDLAVSSRGLAAAGGAASQWLGIGLCDGLRLDWSRRTGTWHDVVMRMRPDVVYPRTNEADEWAWLCRNRDPCMLWSAVCDDRRVDDVLWAAGGDAMARTAQHWQRFVGRGGNINHDLELHEHLRSVGVVPEQALMEHRGRMYAPVREGVEHLDPLLEFPEIYKADLRLYSHTQVTDDGRTVPTEEWFVVMDKWIGNL